MTRVGQAHMSDPNSAYSVSSVAVGGARSLLWQFGHDLWARPGWHKAVLGLAALICGLGWAHWGYHAATSAGPATAPSVVNNSAVVNNSSGAPPQSPPVVGQLARRVGGSILLGFVIGWLFRAFIRITAAMTAIGIGALALLSYFHIMNVDLTAAQTKTTQTSAWLTEQAGRLRDAAFAHVHSTLGGAVGMFMGVRRRKI
jgi:uncharacterized membrane protein (Fun14 family)